MEEHPDIGAHDTFSEDNALVIYCQDLLLVDKEDWIHPLYDEAISRGAQINTDMYDKDFIIYPIFKT